MLFFLVNDLVNALAEVVSISIQHLVDKKLLNGVFPALTFHITASQQRITADDKDHEMLLADKTDIDTEFHSVPEDIQTNIDSVQDFSAVELKRTKTLDCERFKRLCCTAHGEEGISHARLGERNKSNVDLP